MPTSKTKPYVPPPRLVPQWALKLTSISDAETPVAEMRTPAPTSTPRVYMPSPVSPIIVVKEEPERCPISNAPRAPAAMLPALPQCYRGKRYKPVRPRKPYKLPPPPATSIMDYRLATPTRQKSKPSTLSSVVEVPEEADRDIETEGENLDQKTKSTSGMKWDPKTSKEFIPRLSTPIHVVSNDLEVAGIDAQDWAVLSEQIEQDRRTLSSSLTTSSPATTSRTSPDDFYAVRDNVTTSDVHLIEADYTGRTPRKPKHLSSIPPVREVDTFEYSTVQREADYRELFRDSTIDTTEPVYTLSNAPEFSIFAEWRDEYTEDYLHVLRAEHHKMNTILEDAFTIARRQGLNMKAEGLEAVRNMVWLGHDYSERGIYKFNEQLAARTRNEMMRIAGTWRRICLERRPEWFSSGDEGTNVDETADFMTAPF